MNYITKRIETIRIKVWKEISQKTTVTKTVISDASKLSAYGKGAGFVLDVYSAGQAMSKGEGDWSSFQAELGVSVSGVAFDRFGMIKLGFDAGFLGANLITGGGVPSDITSRALRATTSEKASDAYADSAVKYLICEGVPVECLYDPSQCGVNKYVWKLAVIAALYGYRDPNSACSNQ